jgi:23S rRNA (cytosine1962-C5)-methyltransferase
VQPGLEQLANRLARVHKHLRKWARRSEVTCYRLYEKDISDQPLIVDWYDGDVVAWAFDRTRNDTPAAEEAWLAEVVEAIRAGLGVSAECIHLKRRFRQQDRQHGGQYQPLGRSGVTKVVSEGPLRFEVNLSDYLDTGLFLDHRPLRAAVRAQASGRDILNLFCYTGAFTCHAAAGGAASTTSVDLSNTYLEWAERNMRLNEIAIGERHRLIKADVTAYLADEKRRYDFIICDPPTFSNSTSMRGTFAVERDHPALIASCLRLLKPQGTLCFSSNFRGLQLASDAIPARFAAEEITELTIPEDFRNKKIHRTWEIRRASGDDVNVDP